MSDSVAVLVLDHNTSYVASEDPLIYASYLDRSLGRAQTPVVTAQGKKMAEEASKHDFVIIGHNNGAGLAYAESLPEGMRSRVLVVTDNPSTFDAAAYEALGIYEFGRRDHALEWLLTGAKQEGLIETPQEALEGSPVGDPLLEAALPTA